MYLHTDDSGTRSLPLMCFINIIHIIFLLLVITNCAVWTLDCTRLLNLGLLEQHLILVAAC